MIEYHDREWGAPLHDDRKWFEFIVLDAFQAGLSWRAILHKREGFRRVFHGFDPERVADMDAADLAKAAADPGIVRNRLKIESAVKNARAFLALQKAEGSFDNFIWSFNGGKTVQNAWRTSDEVPTSTPLSDNVSAALKSAGFSFVGTTICYAFLQAGGIVNDHLVSCHRHAQLVR